MPKTKSGSSRKLGRNKTKAAGYRGAGRLEKNTVRKLRKHIKAQPHDTAAQAALGRLKLWAGTK